jgi:hypothetical protein
MVNSVERLQEQSAYSGNRIELAMQKVDQVITQLGEMTGGATNLASFMQSVSADRTKMNSKLEKIIKKLDLLET